MNNNINSNLFLSVIYSKCVTRGVYVLVGDGGVAKRDYWRKEVEYNCF